MLTLQLTLSAIIMSSSLYPKALGIKWMTGVLYNIYGGAVI